MIEKKIISDDLKTFIFTGKHIYWYIYSISETSSVLQIVNNIILNYSDIEKKKFFEEEILKSNNGSILLESIFQLMNQGSVIHSKSSFNTNISVSIKWLEGLYLNQLGKQLDPPPLILEKILNLNIN